MAKYVAVGEPVYESERNQVVADPADYTLHSLVHETDRRRVRLGEVSDGARSPALPYVDDGEPFDTVPLPDF
jgi:hypothetical protein